MEEPVFKSLIVWQKAMVFVGARRLATGKMPVAPVLAEGNGRNSRKDYVHFLAIARGSLYEVMTQLELARDLGYVTRIDSFNVQAIEIARILNTMISRLSH